MVAEANDVNVDNDVSNNSIVYVVDTNNVNVAMNVVDGNNVKRHYQNFPIFCLFSQL